MNPLQVKMNEYYVSEDVVRTSQETVFFH